MSLGGWTPPKPRHECVGTAQVAALQAEVAELAAFKAEVVELYTTNFMGKVTLPDPTTLLPRIRMDRMIAQTARTAMHRDGAAPDKGVPLNLRSHLTAEWLKGLQQRLAFRRAAARLECDLTKCRGECCAGRQCVAPYRVQGNVTVSPHPSAKQVAEPDLAGREQLDRIEGLARQGATGSVFWPCFLTAAATLTAALAVFR